MALRLDAAVMKSMWWLESSSCVGDGGEVGGWVQCCAHVNVHHGCACVADRLHQEEQEHTYNILPLYTC